MGNHCNKILLKCLVALKQETFYTHTMWVVLLMTMRCLSSYSISDGIFFKALHQLVAVEKVDNQLDALLSPHMKPSTSNREIAS
jgi:hypothetical protein